MVLGGVDFTDLKLTFGKSSIMYGNFIQTIFDFLIIAAAIFMFVKVFNKLTSRKEEEEEKRKKFQNQQRRSSSWRNSRLIKTTKLF
ncbi:MscL family protein [Bacillus cereus]